VPPHAGRRHEQADEALAGGRDLRRLHRHAAPAQGQADDADVFGTYIHTYKFHEGVADGVFSGTLQGYEARRASALTSQAAIDAWFEQEDHGASTTSRRAVLRKPLGDEWRS
jgi:hypothetical protein